MDGALLKCIKNNYSFQIMTEDPFIIFSYTCTIFGVQNVGSSTLTSVITGRHGRAKVFTNNLPTGNGKHL
jgi:hypothetical protein